MPSSRVIVTAFHSLQVSTTSLPLRSLTTDRAVLLFVLKDSFERGSAGVEISQSSYCDYFFDGHYLTTFTVVCSHLAYCSSLVAAEAPDAAASSFAIFSLTAKTLLMASLMMWTL
jgi:hypothetical protein